MRGVWRPTTAGEAERLAIVVAYAAAAAQPTGIAPALTKSWHPHLRRAAALATQFVGVAMTGLGICINLLRLHYRWIVRAANVEDRSGSASHKSEDAGRPRELAG